MSANDLSRAKARLRRGDYTCVLVKGKQVLTSREKGITPLLKFIAGGSDFRGYCAADKIVGKAAALLYVYMGIEEVYAAVASSAAATIIRSLQYEKLVPEIINRKGDGICPIEQAVKDIATAEEAYLLLK